MEFFNRYRDLFGVPEGTFLPEKKLSINNSLFIDKPFIPTYTESYNLNSKLKALKKDYDDLESQILEIEKTPKRAMSRRGRQNMGDSIKDSSRVSERANKNMASNSQPLKADIFSGKRASWLHDEQRNLNKHSEIDFIFNHKIKEKGPALKNPYENRVRAENFMFGTDFQQPSPPRVPQRKNIQEPSVNSPSHEPEERGNRKNRLKASQVHSIHSTNLSSQQNQQSQSKGGSDDAVRRRKEAKKNIQTRREKLSFLLRTSW